MVHDDMMPVGVDVGVGIVSIWRREKGGEGGGWGWESQQLYFSDVPKGSNTRVAV